MMRETAAMESSIEQVTTAFVMSFATVRSWTARPNFATPVEISRSVIMPSSARVPLTATSAEIEVQQQENDEQRQRHDDREALLGAFVELELAAPDSVIARRELDRGGDGLLRIGDVAAEIALAGIDENVSGKLGVLRTNATWSAHQLHRRHLPERNGSAVG